MKKKNELLEIFRLFKGADWNRMFFAPTHNDLLQLGRYALVGGCAFAADFGTYCFLEYLRFHYLLAGFLSFAVGFLFNFLISRWMIFRTSVGSEIDFKEFASVLIISVIGLFLTEVLLFAGTYFLKMNPRICKILASLIVLLWNYFARKTFVYGKTEDDMHSQDR